MEFWYFSISAMFNQNSWKVLLKKISLCDTSCLDKKGTTWNLAIMLLLPLNIYFYGRQNTNDPITYIC